MALLLWREPPPIAVVDFVGERADTTVSAPDDVAAYPAAGEAATAVAGV
jgi:hypothetical protein